LHDSIHDSRTRQRLLQAARRAIEADVTGGKEPTEAHDEMWPALPNHGVFVTLRLGGQLRGCIGTFHPEGDLVETIRRIAVEAVHDSRFCGAPLTKAELPALRIELSLLTALRPVKPPGEIEIGRHGVHVRIGLQRGCFLPSVATDHGWNVETFLARCCAEKLGVEPDAWRQADAAVSVFEVEKVAED
jgi:AmmeMemoRadiSam system protein A